MRCLSRYTPELSRLLLRDSEKCWAYWKGQSVQTRSPQLHGCGIAVA